MGGLYGSEYWTYLLPKRVGHEVAEQLTEHLLPISAKKAWRLGFIDNVLDKSHSIFRAQVRQLTNVLIADSKELQYLCFNKANTRKKHEIAKPLSAYRQYELTQMYANFYSSNDYHEARREFIYKVAKKGTPANIAKHRQSGMMINKFFRRRPQKNKTVFADKNRPADNLLGI